MITDLPTKRTWALSQWQTFLRVFTYKTVAYSRYGTKLHHCHAVYTAISYHHDKSLRLSGRRDADEGWDPPPPKAVEEVFERFQNLWEVVLCTTALLYIVICRLFHIHMYVWLSGDCGDSDAVAFCHHNDGPCPIAELNQCVNRMRTL